MNDITKARYFLQTKGSKLKDLPSFGLMFATAQSRFKEVRASKVGKPGDEKQVDPVEVNALIDYAVLKYLKKYNQLPGNAGEVLREGTTLEEKRDAALGWLNG